MGPNSKQSPRHLTALVLIGLAVASAVLLAVSGPHTPLEALARGDNDDIMRFLSVRDWRAGQDWYDLTQYRVVAPQGLDLHWSRYVDTGIAGMIWLASLAMPVAEAELFAIVAWPTGLLVAMILLSAGLTWRLFGAAPAVIAAFAVASWPVLTNNYFAVARLDHHNVQILLMTVVLAGLVWPKQSLLSGALAGAAAGLSLAVGLESLLPIALAGLVYCARTVWSAGADGRALTGFGLAFASVSFLAFVGQTPPAERYLAYCDQLSPPFLMLSVSAALVGCGLAVGSARLPSRLMRFGLLVALTTICLVAISPSLMPCLIGPYGHLPVEVQALIYNGIGEALPALSFLETGADTLLYSMMPLTLVMLVSAGLWGTRLKQGQTDAAETRAITTCLLFALLGVIGALFQIRMLLMGAPAFAPLAAYSLYRLWLLRGATQNSLASLLLVATAANALMPQFLYPALRDAFHMASPAQAAQTTGDPSACRMPEHLEVLTALSTATVMAPGSMSTSILLATNHDVRAAPYHRNAQALANGVLPFREPAEAFRATLAANDARYLVLCAHHAYPEGGAAHALAAGETLEGFLPLPVPQGSPLQLFKVLPL